MYCYIPSFEHVAHDQVPRGTNTLLDCRGQVLCAVEYSRLSCFRFNQVASSHYVLDIGPNDFSALR